jgi:hypothetical protein
VSHILDFLKPKDLAKVRTVCKKMKNDVDEYRQLGKALENVIVLISYDRNAGPEEEMSIQTFLNHVKTLKYSNFHVEFVGCEFFDNDDALKKFKSVFGRSIRRIHVSIMCKCVRGTEFEFYQTLLSLQHLVIDKINGPCAGRFRDASRFRVPSVALGQLKLLDIKECDDQDYYMNIIRMCPSLEDLSIPTFNTPHVSRDKLCGDLLTCLDQSHIKKISGNLTTLLIHDIKLLEMIERKGIKLARFDGSQLETVRLQLPEPEKPCTLYSIISIVNIGFGLKTVNLPNLELIENRGLRWGLDEPRRGFLFWPDLKKLVLTQIVFINDRLIAAVFTSLLKSVVRPSVDSVEMEFVNHGAGFLDTIEWSVRFPNLKDLCLTSDTFRSIQPILGWAVGLEHLSRLALSNTFPDHIDTERVLFILRDFRALKMLTLELNWEKARVSDLFFVDVLSNKPLTHVQLSGSAFLEVMEFQHCYILYYFVALSNWFITYNRCQSLGCST